MAETKQAKTRIYKLASEYNLSADVIIEFLKKKGYEIKSHMSILSEEMMNDINSHYKKDIEKAEQHYKKIAEFQKKRGDKKEEAPAKEEPVKTKGKAAEKVKEEAAVEEEKEVPVEPEKTEPQVAEIKTEETEVVEKAEESVTDEIETPEKIEDSKLDKSIEEIEDKVSVFKTETEKSIKRQRGLKVVGKIDLKPKVKQPETKEEEAEPEKPKTAVADGKEEPVKKKRKKKKTKVKKTEPVVEDPKQLKKKKKAKKFEVDEREVDEAIRKTLLSMEETAASGRAIVKKKKRKERQEIEEQKELQKSLEKMKIIVTEFIAVNELAVLMNVSVSDVISKCIGLGLMVSINQRLDVDTITLVADEFGFEVEFEEEYTAEALEDIEDEDETLVHRPAVVTIMGHVDHGKTSLLDYIRRTNVVAGESGGITQHIGAYKVELETGKSITFLDTPGHEAFTAMRARGAQVTDIVVLIVAADDAVMPQTLEAINHAQAAGVPMIIAINKIDKPGANTEKIRQQLADRNILVEDWGGKYQCVEVSAKSGFNIELLMEKILLEADMLDLKANPDRKARGVVIEAQLDKGKGIIGTILVQKGTLKIGNPFVSGVYHGRVRAMFDERGNKVPEATPSTPVQVVGFEGSPLAGDVFVCVESERVAREIAMKRHQLKREQDQKQVRHITLDDLSKQISIGGIKELPLIVKGDVDGSVEALADSLMKLSNEEVKVRVIHRGVGGISEGDVLLAAASNAIILGFHVRPHLNARKLAESENVDIRLYNVIYDAIEEVKMALEGLLSPVISEQVTATIDVRETFKVPKVGTIAGCYVLDGKVQRNNKIRVIRDGIVIFNGELASLKRFKDDVKEVDAGYECGLNVNNFNDVKVGDIIEAYKLIETKKKLV